jgi:hypothetical protein
MTPKEKAEELVDKYFKLLNYEFGDLVYSLKDKPPHKCALIAVDEIIEWSSQWSGLHNEISYWQEVKKEIELL